MNPSVGDGNNPGAGPIPGNGQNSATLPFKNFQISDVGSNFDYSFRAGLFAGDYSGNTAGAEEPERQGEGRRPDRGTSAPTRGTVAARATRRTSEPGRNPICEQSDAFFQRFNADNGGKGAKGNAQDSVNLFSVAACPADIKDKGAKH